MKTERREKQIRTIDNPRNSHSQVLQRDAVAMDQLVVLLPVPVFVPVTLLLDAHAVSRDGRQLQESQMNSRLDQRDTHSPIMMPVRILQALLYTWSDDEVDEV